MTNPTPSDHHEYARAHVRRGVPGRTYVGPLPHAPRDTVAGATRARSSSAGSIRTGPEPIRDKPVPRSGRPGHERQAATIRTSPRMGGRFAYDSVAAGQSTTDVFVAIGERLAGSRTSRTRPARTTSSPTFPLTESRSRTPRNHRRTQRTNRRPRSPLPGKRTRLRRPSPDRKRSTRVGRPRVSGSPSTRTAPLPG